MFTSKYLLIFLFSFTTIFSFSQQRRTATFGEPTHQELTMMTYDKDPEANAVVLFEKGNNYFKYSNGYIYIIKEVHRKIKVIDAKQFDNSTIDINLYNNGSDKEKITTLKAITHNGNSKTYLKSSDIFDIDRSDNWTIKRFTFPNIKNGSIIEYTYTLRTPFFFYFGEWSYQGEFPKIYSEFNSEIPGNYVYNRVIYGKNDLVINEASVKKDCFSLPNYANPADCEVAHYAMKDIPAFKEENYMLAKSNYISRVDYELIYYYNYDGAKIKFSKTWKDVDKEFKHDKDIGRQLKNKAFFESNIPADILSINDDLEKSKAIYTYLQNYFTWNGNTSVFSKARVKKAFDAKTGSSTEINLSLINALQAADIDAKLVLHSTRDNGLPALAYPVITDFNYLLVLVKINEETYLLDASDKYTPFGIIPFRALNLRGRVMDFKEESYWHTIIPNEKNVNYISAQLSLKDELLTGEVSEISTGYKAMNKRKEFRTKSKNEYLLSKEEKIPELEITYFSSENSSELEKPFKEKFEIEYLLETIGNKIYINPFLLQNELKENPFKSEERSFPVNIGYPISNTYMISINLNNNYEVEQLPKNKVIEFAGGTGQCKVIYGTDNSNVSLRFNFKLSESYFMPEDYKNLKEFFNQVVEVLNNEVIVLNKV